MGGGEGERRDARENYSVVPFRRRGGETHIRRQDEKRGRFSVFLLLLLFSFGFHRISFLVATLSPSSFPS